MIEDYDELPLIYKEKYRLLVLPRWRKKLILIKLFLTEILFLITIIPMAIKTIIFYWFSHKKGYIIKDVRYGPKPRNTSDIYIPTKSNYLNNNKKDCPVVLFVHGGSWGFGHKLQYVLLGKKLSERGIILMAINYTLHPKGNIDDMLEDTDTALRFCYDNIENYGGDKNKIYLMGHSAGGHIVSLYGVENYSKPTDQLSDNEKNKNRIPIQGIFSLSAPLHINDHFLHETTRGLEHLSPMRPAMKGPKNFDKYSPTRVLERIKDKSIRDDRLPVPFPAFYILHGEKDGTVPLSSSTKFFAVLMQKLANPSARTLFLKSYPNIKHIDFIFDMYSDQLVITRNIFAGIDSDSDDDQQSNAITDFAEYIKTGKKNNKTPIKQTKIRSTILNDIINIITH